MLLCHIHCLTVSLPQSIFEKDLQSELAEIPRILFLVLLMTGLQCFLNIGILLQCTLNIRNPELGRTLYKPL